MSMRRLELDLRGGRRRSRRLGALLLAAALTAAGALGWEFSELQAELAALELHIEQAGARHGAPAAVSRASQNVRNAVLEVKQAAHVAGQLNVPWDELFSALESAMTADVALLSIESDIEQRRVRLSGEARNLGAILAYVRELRARPVLADIYLLNHDVQELDPQHPVRFAVTASWAHGRASGAP